MTGQAIRLAAIDRNKLVDTIAVDEAAVENRYLGVLERKELPIEVDGHEND